MAPHDINLPRRGVDAEIVRRASKQERTITRQQLRQIGLRDNHAVARRGWLFPVHRGVYSVGGPPRTGIEHAAAALLACGDGAALSHDSAMVLWGMWKRWELPIHIAVPGDRRPTGVRVHRLRGLKRSDIRLRQRLRITSPARTLLDIAPAMTDRSLRRRVNDARRAELLGLADLADVVERFPHHPGARRLKPILTVKGGPTRSEWEDGFPVFCKQHGLPEPVMCTYVAGYEVDALFVAERLIVELDSWDYHSDREAFESDRDRDADTLAADHETVRITWTRIEQQTAREAARLHQILDLRRRRLAA